MKNALIIFMVLAAFGMTAQNKSLEKKGHRKEMKSNLTPEERVDFKLKKMTAALDLNTDQQAKMKQLFLEKGNDKSGMHKNRKEMTDEQREEAKKAMVDRRVAYKNQMKEILTEDQMIKWEGMQSERRNKSNAKKIRKNGAKD